MSLTYLHFDASDNTDGLSTFDAMASVLPRDLPALQAEIARVLAWAHRQHADGPGPADDGHLWDYDLQASRERSTLDRWRYDAASGRFDIDTGTTEVLRHTLTLTLSAHPALAERFRKQFGPFDAE